MYKDENKNKNINFENQKVFFLKTNQQVLYFDWGVGRNIICWYPGGFQTSIVLIFSMWKQSKDHFYSIFLYLLTQGGHIFLIFKISVFHFFKICRSQLAAPTPGVACYALFKPWVDEVLLFSWYSWPAAVSPRVGALKRAWASAAGESNALFRRVLKRALEGAELCLQRSL